MKIVLLTQRVYINKAYGERRDALDQRYSDYIATMGFAPYPVPNLPDHVPEMFQGLDISGLVLTGGNDIAAYGGDAPERDETERKLIAHCQSNNIPMLGICRGMQMLAHVCIGAGLSRSPEHIGVRHNVTGAITKSVNSYHSWKVDPFDNKDYEILAQSDDSNIESFRHVERPLIGIMWHPEREFETDVTERKRLKHFFETGKFQI